jgi:general secretion pathway protein B
VAEPAPWPSADARSETRNETRKPAAKAGTPARAADDGAPTQLAAAAPAVLPLDQLTANLRAQLPALAFGGSMYSSNPANRSLIINGQIHRENDRIAGDLTLLEIRPRGAVFGFKGQRFEVPY